MLINECALTAQRARMRAPKEGSELARHLGGASDAAPVLREFLNRGEFMKLAYYWLNQIMSPLVLLLLAACASAAEPWWRNAVIYEIYPRSFADTNGDGIGDLNGITAHLDYLKNLGVDALWIAPFYPSPLVDFGYDVKDYQNVAPEYGTLADFDRLASEAKKRNIHVLIDLVVNHTSNQHPWFLESKSSKTNPKADWYVWRDAKPAGGPPNNWGGRNGSSWEWVPERQQYYYHHYAIVQPDLNWRNPEVREAVFNVMRFWLKRGASGFRMDGISNLYEDAELRDEPARPAPATGPQGAQDGVAGPGRPGGFGANTRTSNLPETFAAFKMLRKVTDEFPDAILIAQVQSISAPELARAYGDNRDAFQLPINAAFGRSPKLDAAAFRQKVIDAETKLNGNTPLDVLDTHDGTRSWTRFGDGVHDLAIAKLMATYLLAPRGAALVYYGQEIGMQNRDPQTLEEVQDVNGKRGWPNNKGRDGERTPMQWTAERNAGFSTAAKTWLPIADGYQERNAALEADSPNSLLNYYKALIRLRRENAGLRDGEFQAVDAGDDNIVAWLSKSGAESAIVALNFSALPKTISLPTERYGLTDVQATTLISNTSDAGTRVAIDKLTLPPYGAFIGTVKTSAR
jgi:alpha-glucosidase